MGLMTAPVSLHRFLFGRHEKDTLVRVGALFAKLGMASMGLTLVAVVVLIFGVVVDDTAGVIAGAAVLVFYSLAWVVLPARRPAADQEATDRLVDRDGVRAARVVVHRLRVAAAHGLELGAHGDAVEQRDRREQAPQQQREDAGERAVDVAERRALVDVRRQQAGGDAGSAPPPRPTRGPATRGRGCRRRGAWSRITAMVNTSSSTPTGQRATFQASTTPSLQP